MPEPRDARTKASVRATRARRPIERLGGRYEVRVLEPSPPAIAADPFTDDPAAFRRRFKWAPAPLHAAFGAAVRRGDR